MVRSEIRPGRMKFVCEKCYGIRLRRSWGELIRLTCVEVGHDPRGILDALFPLLETSDERNRAGGCAAFATEDYTYENGLFTTVADRITVPAATITQNPEIGRWIVAPGVSELTVTSTV